MDLVKEYINEKFTDEGDPIHDMGIGNITWETLKPGDILMCIQDNDISNKNSFLKIKAIHEKNKFKLKLTATCFFTGTSIKQIIENTGIINFTFNSNFNSISSFWKKYFRIIQPREIKMYEHMNEKFVSDSDPINDMGIGIRALIDNYIFKEMGIIKKDIKKYNFGSSTGYNGILSRLSQQGKSEIIPYLLQLPEINVSDNNSFALRWAAANGHFDIVKLLLDAGADINGFDSGTALSCALLYNHTKIVDYLLKLGAEIHKCDYSYATDNDRKKIKKSTNKKVNENINEKFIANSDPVHDMGIGLDELLKNCIEKIMNENEYSRFTYDIKNNIFKWGTLSGLVALISFLAKYDQLEMLKLVIEQKHANPRDDKSLALRWAAARGNVPMIKYLIKHGADPDDSDQGDSLQCAKTYKRKEAIEYLRYLKNKKNKKVNEVFTSDSDPIHDLGIGEKAAIEYALKRFKELDESKKNVLNYWYTMWFSNNLSFIYDLKSRSANKYKNSYEHTKFSYFERLLKESGLNYFLNINDSNENGYKWSGDISWSIKKRYNKYFLELENKTQK